jgi:OmpA-OmpF porin, OOP family
VVGATTRKIPWVIVVAILSVAALAGGAREQVAHVDAAAPASKPETIADDADFPFLSRISGTSLIQTARVVEPLEVKPATGDSEAMLAGLSFTKKSYTAPLSVWAEAFVVLYRDALLPHGWRIVDQPPATAAETEPHVINLSAHYAANGRDLYARISRTPDGSYDISVADVGAEDWGAILDRTCHLPVFSLHFKHDMRIDYEEALPTVEKLAALIGSRPKAQFEVRGHTDNVGDDLELKQQSMRRATIVAMMLTNAGVARARLTVQGYGKTQPIAPNDTDWGRTKNRRIEILQLGCKVSTKPSLRFAWRSAISGRLPAIGFSERKADSRKLTPIHVNPSGLSD